MSKFPLETINAQSLFCVDSFKMLEVRRLGTELCLEPFHGLLATTI